MSSEIRSKRKDWGRDRSFCLNQYFGSAAGQSVFRIRIILMRIRIRFQDNGSGSRYGTGSGSDLKLNKFHFFLLISFCKRFKRITMFFFVIWAYYSRILNKISDFFLKLYFYNYSLFVCEFITIFIYYPEPDQRFLKWIRIWIRPNDTDPTGSGSETLRTIVGFSDPVSRDTVLDSRKK